MPLTFRVSGSTLLPEVKGEEGGKAGKREQGQVCVSGRQGGKTVRLKVPAVPSWCPRRDDGRKEEFVGKVLQKEGLEAG